MIKKHFRIKRNEDNLLTKVHKSLSGSAGWGGTGGTKSGHPHTTIRLLTKWVLLKLKKPLLHQLLTYTDSPKLCFWQIIH